jgi:SAM-dependent methyltransferase
MDIARIYDTIAQDYANKRGGAGVKMKLAANYIKSGMRILDLGCGYGRFLDVVPPKVDYVGSDISKNLLAIAKKKYPQAKFILADMAQEKVWKKLGKFDAVFSFAVFHHLTTPAIQKKVLRLIYNSLNNQGLLMIVVMNLWKKNFLRYHIKQRSLKTLNIPWKLSDGKKVIKTVPRPFYSFTRSELKKLVKGLGFKIIKEFFTHGQGILDAKEFGIIARK